MTGHTKIKVALVSAVVLALVGVGAAGAIAANDVLSRGDEAKAVIDDAAAELGVEASELTDALQEALKNRVDEAVEDGRLTDEQGERLKQRIESAEIPFPFGGFGLRRPHLELHGHVAKLEAAAEYLNLTEAELRDRLADGDTLAEVARAEGKSVDGLVQALVAAARERLDDAVADGRLTREQADELADELAERMRGLVNGELPQRRFGERFGGGLGPRLWHDFERPAPSA